MSEQSPKSEYKYCPLCRERNLGAASECARCGFGFERAPRPEEASWLDRKLAEKGVVCFNTQLCLGCLKEIPVEAELCPHCGRAQEPPGEAALNREYLAGRDYFWMPESQDALQGVDAMPHRAQLEFLALGAVALAIVGALMWALAHWLG